ncbi:19470_t:CDS:2 [Funneliformis geosporum]|nr:19470_t:CDS:2 [Funneliformis geosporum]
MSSPKKHMNLDVYNIIEIKDWSYDILVKRIKALDYKETDIKNIRDQDLTGRAFLRLTEEKLPYKPGLYELKPSPAESIMELVEELNEKLDNQERIIIRVILLFANAMCYETDAELLASLMQFDIFERKHQALIHLRKKNDTQLLAPHKEFPWLSGCI